LDEPVNSFDPDPDSYGHLDHIYSFNQPETRDILKEMWETIKNVGEDK